MTDTADPNDVAFPIPPEAVRSGWNSVTMSAADYVQGYASACVAWQQEMARFLDMRLAQNRSTWAALASSHGAADAIKVQQEWALKTATDYAEEANRLACLATTLALTGTTPEVQGTAAIMG